MSTYGLDVLVVVAAVSSAVNTALREDRYRLTGLAGWFEVVAIAGATLTLLLRRRFAFAAPAALFVISAALSFLDGRIVSSQPGIFIAGIGAAVLLGNLRDERQARIGLTIVVGGAAIIVYNDPTQTPDDSSSSRCCSRSPGWSGTRCVSARSGPRPPSNVRRGPNGSGRQRPGSRSPRSERGSRASSTTSWRTR